MRGLLLLVLGLAGCAAETLRGEKSAWWPCIATGSNENLSAMMTAVADRGIAFTVIGAREVRLWTAYECRDDAAAALRASPVAATLRFHDVLAGPRPDASLPQVGPGEDAGIWTEIGSLRRPELPVERVQSILHAAGIECGVVAFFGSPDRAVIFVPTTSVHDAKSLLRKQSMGDALRIDP